MLFKHLFKACLALADYNEKFPLTAEQVVGFGNFVANGFRPTTTSEIYYFIRLVSDLNNNKYAQPIHVQAWLRFFRQFVTVKA